MQTSHPVRIAGAVPQLLSAACLLALLLPWPAAAVTVTGTTTISALAGTNGDGGTPFCVLTLNPPLTVNHGSNDQTINNIDYYRYALVDSADGRQLSDSFQQVQQAFSPNQDATVQLPSAFSPAPTGPVHLVLVDIDAGGSPVSSYLIDIAVPEALIRSGPQQCQSLLPNQPPQADAGAEQLVSGGATVQLNGSGSSDPDNDALSFSWTQIAGPAVTLDNPAVSQPQFAAPAASTVEQQLVFRLTVSDGSASSSADVVVRIAAMAASVPPAFRAPEVIPASSLPARLLLLLGVLGVAGLFLARPRLSA